VSTAFLPGSGELVLAPATLGAVLDHARGRPLPLDVGDGLADAGVLEDDRLAPPVDAVVSILLGAGPRCRVLSRARGRLTVTDIVVAPDRADAAVVTRPPGAEAVHVRATSRGGAIRHVARLIGIGPHVLTDPPLDGEIVLDDWAAVRESVDWATPAGWAAAWRRVALHQVRWAQGPATRAGTAIVVAVLDGGLAEIRPRPDDDGFAVTAAEPRSVWARLCLLTTPSTR
jgi:hypothetical protein